MSILHLLCRWAFALLVLATGAAGAQTATWRVATYGIESTTVDVTRGALAFDAHDELYAFEYLAGIDTTSVRLARYSGYGRLLWQRDIPASLQNLSYVGPSEFTPSVALATIGDDAVVATTQQTFPFAAAIARFRATDGQPLWHSVEQMSGGVGYSAVAVDGSDDVIAAGAVELSPSAIVGHVAKFGGTDGAARWKVDIDPQYCEGTQSLMLSTAVVDGNADVIVAGAPADFFRSTIDVCVLKIDGGSGSVLWAHTHPASSPQISLGGPLALNIDTHGNVVVGARFSAGDGYLASIFKLAGGGGAAVWERTSHGDALANLQSLAVDAHDNVYISAPGGTRAYAAADGHVLWPADVPNGGAVGVDPNGNVVIAENRMDSIPDPHTDFYALDPATGSSLWHSVYAFGDITCCSTLNILALDHSGHFAAAQRDPEPCCGKVITTVHGNTATGTLDWHASDSGFAPSYALLDDGVPHTGRVSVSTPDDGVVTIGEAYRYSPLGGTISTLRIMTVKRSARDGHLQWRGVAEMGEEDCEPSGVRIDGNGDVIVVGTCFDGPATIKYRGGDGVRQWVAREQDVCDDAGMQSVALDSAGDVYVSGWCNLPAAEDQLTVKYSGADGHVLWTAHSAGDFDSYTPMAVAVGGGAVVAAASQQTTIGGQSSRRLLVNGLDAASGQPLWSRRFDPTPGGAYTVSGILVLPDGDTLVSGNGIAVRLGSASGTVRWNVASDATTEGVVAANGAVFFAAGMKVWKVDTASGAVGWEYVAPDMSGFYGGFHDVTLAVDGTVLAVGTATQAQSGRYFARVVALDPTSGVSSWTFTDNVTYGDEGLGVVATRDGGVDVSTNYAVPDSSPWSLLRITGPFADGIFANGYED